MIDIDRLRERVTDPEILAALRELAYRRTMSNKVLSMDLSPTTFDEAAATLYAVKVAHTEPVDLGHPIATVTKLPVRTRGKGHLRVVE